MRKQSLTVLELTTRKTGAASMSFRGSSSMTLGQAEFLGPRLMISLRRSTTTAALGR